MIKQPADWPVRWKLSTVVSLGVLVVALFGALWFPNFVQQRAAIACEERGVSVSVLLASAIRAGLEFQDLSFLQAELARLSDVPDARWAAVWDANGRLVAGWPDRTERPLPAQDIGWSQGELIVYREVERLGFVAVGFDAASVREARTQAMYSVWAFTATFVASSLAVAWWLVGTMTRPLTWITKQFDLVALGSRELEQIDTSVPELWSCSGDEVRRMSWSLDRMRDKLIHQLEEIRRQRERAVDAEQRSHAASRAKSTFLANMSHELRTPLNAILGYSELLREEGKERGQDWCGEDLDKVVFAGRHLLSLINSILDLSKVEAGQMEIHYAVVALDELVESSRDAVLPQIAGNGTTLTVALPAQGLSLFSDATRLRQCLINLLGNAAKFTIEGTIRLDVWCEPEADGRSMISFRVTDTGPGIPPDVLPRLFEPFVQGEDQARMSSGTGLGLALTRRLARLMGGDVTLFSDVGIGSAFTLRVPGTLFVRTEDEVAPAPVTPSPQPTGRVGPAPS